MRRASANTNMNNLGSSLRVPTASSAYPSQLSNTHTSEMSHDLIIARANPTNNGNIFKAKFDRYLIKSDLQKKHEQEVAQKINDEILKRFL